MSRASKKKSTTKRSIETSASELREYASWLKDVDIDEIDEHTKQYIADLLSVIAEEKDPKPKFKIEPFGERFLSPVYEEDDSPAFNDMFYVVGYNTGNEGEYELVGNVFSTRRHAQDFFDDRVAEYLDMKVFKAKLL